MQNVIEQFAARPTWFKVVAVGVLACAGSLLMPKEPQNNPIEAEISRSERIEQFFGYDGAATHLTQDVKRNLQNPGSFRHVKSNYADMGNFVAVKMEFNHRLASGEPKTNTVTAKIDTLDGSVIEWTVEPY